MAAPTPEMDHAIRARLSSELEQMLSQPPHEALGVSASASEAAVRARFLVVAKVYHPSRFARLSSETKRVANEVFLQFREAYETLKAQSAKASAAADDGESKEPSSRVRAAASTRLPAASSARLRRASMSGKQYRSENPISSRGEKVEDAPSTRTSARYTARQPSTSRPVSTARQPSTARRVPTSQRIAVGTTQKPAIASARPRPNSVQDLAQAIKGTERRRNEQYENALKMLAAGMTTESRAEFQKLAVADPREKKYRLQFHYCLGLEHEEAGRFEEARSEFQRAINIDETFRRAHESMDRLPKLKKPGRLSKLFGRD